MSAQPPRGRQPARGMDARQIADWLRTQITDGVWGVGEPLPTNADLIKQTGASNSTVSKAISTLKSEGLIFGRRGGRPRVADLRAMDYRVTDQTRPTWQDIQAASDMFNTIAKARGGTSSTEAEALTPPADIAIRLGLPEGETTARRRVVQSISDRVISTETTFYDPEVAAELGLYVNEDIPEGTSRRIGASRHADTAWTTETTVRPATSEEITLFAITPGTSMLQVITTAANPERVTSVSTRVVHPQGVRIVHEIGLEAGLRTIRANRDRL
ncbi:GntR family transcriptional regulator [Streptomyces sp. NPDC048277]|uniref:GntR family transcriptional regulator n=1 Tax=Streptomyces sp. NPDC048277 TaxID=3155027 RepID=UPI0033F4DC9B